MRYLILLLIFNLSCLETNTRDWSFLEMIDAQLIVYKKCQVELQNQSSYTPPQDCYALVGNLDLHNWKIEKILTEKEIQKIKREITKNKLSLIPESVIKKNFEYISGDELENNQVNIYEKYGLSEYVILSNPVWVSPKKVILFINRYSENEFTSGGEVFVFERINLKWELIYTQNTWMS